MTVPKLEFALQHPETMAMHMFHPSAYFAKMFTRFWHARRTNLMRGLVLFKRLGTMPQFQCSLGPTSNKHYMSICGRVVWSCLILPTRQHVTNSWCIDKQTTRERSK